MRLRANVILAGSLGLAALSPHLTAQAPELRPKLVVAETSQSLGQIPKGEPVRGEFTLRNEGSAPLALEFHPDALVEIRHADRTIAPGGAGTLRFEVDSNAMTGEIAIGVTVVSSDPERPPLRLTVTGTVRASLAVTPGYVRYIVVQHEREGTIAQTLWATDGTDLEVVKVESDLPSLRVAFREARPEERDPKGQGRQWRVETTLATDSPVGALANFVTIHTNHPREKWLRVPITGFVRPVLAVTPPEGDFQSLRLDRPRRFKFVVRNFATEPIRIEGAETDLPHATTEVVALEDGRRYNVYLNLVPGLPAGALQGVLKIRTSSPKAPQLAVALRGTVLD